MLTLHQAAANVGGALLQDIAAMIVDADRIFCFGVGGSSAVIAEEAENRLFRLGLSALASADPYRQRMTAAIATAKDLFLCISATGKPPSVVESAQLARKNGAKICALAPQGSPLDQTAHLTLPVEIADAERSFNLPSNTHYAQLPVLDCLAAAVAAQLGSASAGKFKAIRAMLNAHFM